ncbi:MAG: endonuclease domain-containing protein [Nitrococcus sp.]|nr:endonuclease domain-containing protein [Nitrococcus sp.]
MEQREFAKHLRRHMTESENRLWRHLRAHRLNGEKFRRQQPIGPYVVDFAHFGARLIVEADGGQHNDAPHDEQRDNWLRAQGFTVLRFWNNEIMGNLEGVLATIMHAVANPPSPPTPLPQGERGEKRASVQHSDGEKLVTDTKPLSPCGRGVGERGKKHSSTQHSDGSK